MDFLVQMEEKPLLSELSTQITRADTGEIFHQWRKLNPHHIKDIGYMPEEEDCTKTWLLLTKFSISERSKEWKKQDTLSQAKYWFDRFRNWPMVEQKLSELSKGMAKKIQFVVTVLHQHY